MGLDDRSGEATRCSCFPRSAQTTPDVVTGIRLQTDGIQRFGVSAARLSAPIAVPNMDSGPAGKAGGVSLRVQGSGASAGRLPGYTDVVPSPQLICDVLAAVFASKPTKVNIGMAPAAAFHD